MAYEFEGFFVAPPRDIVADTRSFLPHAIFRVFTPGEFHLPTQIPTEGVLGVTVPSRFTTDPGEVEHGPPSFRSVLVSLPALSVQHADATFAAICLLCHGGPIEAFGAVLCAGKCIRREEWGLPTNGDESGYYQLISATLAPLGVTLTRGYFPPFERAGFSRFGSPFR